MYLILVSWYNMNCAQTAPIYSHTVPGITNRYTFFFLLLQLEFNIIIA